MNNTVLFIFYGIVITSVVVQMIFYFLNKSGRKQLERRGDEPLSLDEIKVRDAAKDSSTVIWGVFALCALFLGGLFIGDIAFGKNYLTPEIIHSVLSFLVGSCLTAIVTSFFQARAMNQLKESLQNQNKETSR